MLVEAAEAGRLMSMLLAEVSVMKSLTGLTPLRVGVMRMRCSRPSMPTASTPKANSVHSLQSHTKLFTSWLSLPPCSTAFFVVSSGYVKASVRSPLAKATAQL